MAQTLGQLFLVATPIGNLGDMTPRAIETLQGVSFVLAEDTRVTRKLCTHFEIETPLIRFDENVSQRKIPEMIDLLMQGQSLALVSDAGTPCVSDPGNNLASAARDAGIEVIAIPGPSAALVALAAGGILGTTFYFAGFSPRKKGEQKTVFEYAGSLDCPCIFFESPHRVTATIELLAEMYPTRQCVLARELTKLHEEVLRLPLPELAENLKAREVIKGEIVLVLGPSTDEEHAAHNEMGEAQVVELLRKKVEQGLSKSQAVKETVIETGLARNVVYALALKLQKD